MLWSRMRVIAECTAGHLLPHKSRIPYEKQFNNFLEWCNANKVNDI